MSENTTVSGNTELKLTKLGINQPHMVPKGKYFRKYIFTLLSIDTRARILNRIFLFAKHLTLYNVSNVKGNAYALSLSVFNAPKVILKPCNA